MTPISAPDCDCMRRLLIASLVVLLGSVGARSQAQDAAAESPEAARVPRGTVQSPLRKLRESGDPAAIAPSNSSLAKITRYAERMIEKFDRDGDGRLSVEETEGLAESLRVSDFDGDGYISAEEFTRRITAYSRRRSIRIAPLTPPSPVAASLLPPSETVASANQPAVESRGEAAAPAPPKRFVVATQRLPTSVPDWFAKSDTDGDGQVTMAELSAFAPGTAVADFARFDLNGDGVITAEESARAVRPSEAAGSGVGTAPTAPQR